MLVITILGVYSFTFTKYCLICPWLLLDDDDRTSEAMKSVKTCTGILIIMNVVEEYLLKLPATGILYGMDSVFRALCLY